MSKPVSPTRIGGFMLAGLGLLVAGLLSFGGGEYFRPKVHCVVHFDGSLNGLNRGAPVKVDGVLVGKVSEIVLELDEENNRTLRPVVLEIDPSTIVDTRGERLDVGISGAAADQKIRRLVDAGLRAQLETQSLLTGLLFVELSFDRRSKPRFVGSNFRGLPEVPSMPTTVDQVKASLESLVQRLQAMPLEKMVEDLAATVADARSIVASDETRKSRVALAQSLAEANRLLAELNRQLPPLVREVGGAVGSANQAFQTAKQAFQSADRTMAEAGRTAQNAGQTALEATAAIREIRAETKPVLAAAEQALVKATTVLEEARGAMANLSAETDPDSNLQETLAELQSASRSLRVLADYLERNPNALIFGRSR